MIAGGLAALEPPPPSPPPSLHPAALHRATDRSCINATIELRVAQLGASVARSYYKASSPPSKNGCTIDPSATTPGLAAGLSPPLCPVLHIPLPLASCLLPFASCFPTHSPSHLCRYSCTLTSTNIHPDPWALWLLESMAKLWHIPWDTPRSTTSNWKLT